MEDYSTFKPPMSPVMRPVMWMTDHGIMVGEPFLYEVEYSPEKIIQIIYHDNLGTDGDLCRCWQIRPIDSGVCGKWTGKFSSSEEAYQAA